MDNTIKVKVLTPIYHLGKQFHTGETIEVSSDEYAKYFEGKYYVEKVEKKAVKETPATEPEKKEEVTEVTEPIADTPATEPEKKVNKKPIGVN